jgi:hypothetical protein
MQWCKAYWDLQVMPLADMRAQPRHPQTSPKTPAAVAPVVSPLEGAHTTPCQGSVNLAARGAYIQAKMACKTCARGACIACVSRKA